MSIYFRPLVIQRYLPIVQRLYRPVVIPHVAEFPPQRLKQLELFVGDQQWFSVDKPRDRFVARWRRQTSVVGKVRPEVTSHQLRDVHVLGMDKGVAGARFLDALQRVYPALVLSFGTVGEEVPEHGESILLELSFVHRFVVLVVEHQVHLHGVPLMVL